MNDALYVIGGQDQGSEEFISQKSGAIPALKGEKYSMSENKWREIEFKNVHENAALGGPNQVLL